MSMGGRGSIFDFGKMIWMGAGGIPVCGGFAHIDDEEGEGEDDASASAGTEFQEKLDDFERAIREVSERMEGLAQRNEALDDEIMRLGIQSEETRLAVHDSKEASAKRESQSAAGHSEAERLEDGAERLKIYQEDLLVLLALLMVPWSRLMRTTHLQPRLLADDVLLTAAGPGAWEGTEKPLHALLAPGGGLSARTRAK